MSSAGQLLRRLSSFSLTTAETVAPSTDTATANDATAAEPRAAASVTSSITTPSNSSTIPSLSPDTVTSNESRERNRQASRESLSDALNSSVISPSLVQITQQQQQQSKQVTPTYQGFVLLPRANSMLQLDEPLRRNSSYSSDMAMRRSNSFALLSSPVHESVRNYELVRASSSASLSKSDSPYSSLSSRSTTRSKVLFLVFALLAIAFRVISLVTVTTESSMWITMLIKGKTIELQKSVLQSGYFPEIVGQLYQAGGFASLMVTLFGTLFTPFFRIAVVVLCYFYPLHEKHHETRTSLLFIMDHVGRFILVDIFAIGYGAVFAHKSYSLLPFLFHNTKNHGILDGVEGSVDLARHAPFPMVVEDINLTISMKLFSTFYAGLVSNVIGTFLTHHLLLKSIPRAPLSGKDKMGEKQFLFTRLDPTHNSREHLLVITTVIAVLCFGHLLIARAPIVSYQASGFTAQFPAPAEEVNFDLWTIFLKFPHSVYYDPDRKGLAFFGVFILAFVYLTVVITIPLLVCVWALTLVVVPMSKQLQFELLFASPFWFSWCSIDLFLFITVSEYFEIDTITQFMTDDMYPVLCKSVEQVFHQPCAGVKTEFKEGIYSLGLLCAMIIFIRIQFLNLYHKMNENQTKERMPVIL